MLGTHPQYQQQRDQRDTVADRAADLGPFPVSNLKTKKSSLAFDVPLDTQPAPLAPRKSSSGLLPRRSTEPNLHALAHLHHAHDHAAAMARLASLQEHMHDHLHEHDDHVRAVVDAKHARVTELAARLDAEHTAAQGRAQKRMQEKVAKLHKHNEEVAKHKRKHDCGECLRRQASIQYGSFVRHMSEDAEAHRRHMAAGSHSNLQRHATHSGVVAASHRGPLPAQGQHVHCPEVAMYASYAQLRRSYSYAPGMSMAPPLAPLARPTADSSSPLEAAAATSPIEVMSPPVFHVHRSVVGYSMVGGSGASSGSISPSLLSPPPEYCRRSSSAQSIPGCAPLEMGTEE